jgi:hypothetical protein
MKGRILASVLYGLILLIPAQVMVLATTTTDFKVFATGTDNTIHDLNVKASEGANGQVIRISDFSIDPEDVVLLRQGESLVVTTSTNEPQRIEKVKIVDEAGQFNELPQLQAGTWSLAGIATGVYLLDVIVDTPDASSLVAYETVLVILRPDQQPLPLTQYITMVQTVKVKTDVKVIFKENDGDRKRCSDTPGSAGLGFPYQNRTQCELEEWNNCKKIDDDRRSQRCHDLRETFSDDCEGYANLEECNEARNEPLGDAGNPVLPIDEEEGNVPPITDDEEGVESGEGEPGEEESSDENESNEESEPEESSDEEEAS